MRSRVNRIDELRSLKYSNLDGAFATAFATLVGGPFLVGFVKELGGSDLWIGLLTSIPSLLGFVQIFGAVWGASHPGYKRYVRVGGGLWRLFYVPLALLPLIALAGSVKLAILAGLMTCASLCVLMVNPTYNEWLAQMIPESSRGWFFSRRNALMTGVGAVVGAIGGVVLDNARGRGAHEIGFAAVFGLGILCAGLSYYYFERMKDVAHEPGPKPSARETLAKFRAPLASPMFRPVLFFLVPFVLGQTLPGNLFGAYALESLHLPFTLIQLCGAAQALGSILAGRMWGYLADKYGNRPLLLILGFGIALTPSPWIFTRPDDLVWNAAVLLPGHLFSGIVWGGVTVCQFNLVLATSRDEDRATYLGTALATQAILGGIGPLIGAQIMYVLRGVYGGWTGYHAIFWITIGLRMVATLFLLPVKEPNAVSIRETIRKLRRITPGGYAALRKFTVSDNPSQRALAIEEVAASGFALASEEVVGALHDPSPRVRRQAARALAAIGDESAVDALIHQIEEHPDLVDDEVIDALGELGSSTAVLPLIHQLQNPRSSARRAAAHALGRIGDAAAIQPLIRAAKDSGDADLRRASLQALRILGASEAEDAIIAALLDTYPSVRIAAAEAVDELNLVNALEALRLSMRRFDDEAESEVAYALGSIGTPDDIPAILLEASKCVSVTTRRRCLLGIARALQIESIVYRLLLVEGMSRDRQLVERWAPLVKRNRRMQVALNVYASGDEVAALNLLAGIIDDPALRAFAEQPVAELFLVAAVYVSVRPELKR